jgi:hypothetical protein
MSVCCECCVLSARGLCHGLITRPEESYRLWRVVVCDQESSNSRRLKPATGLWKIQPQWAVTPGKQKKLSHNWHDFRIKYVSFVWTTFPWNSSHFKKNTARWDTAINVPSFHVKYPLFLSYFKEVWIFLDRLSKNTQLSTFMKIRPVEAEFFTWMDRLTEGRKDGQTWRS